MPSDLALYGFDRRTPRQRLLCGGATLGLHLALLAALLWQGWRVLPPPASAARDTVVVALTTPQAAPQPRPEQVPPGPRQHASEASRAAARQAAPATVPTITPDQSQPAPPPATDAPRSTSDSAQSRPVERTTAPPAMVAPPAPAPAARENIAAQAQAAKADWQARVLGHLRQYRRYPRAAESAGQHGIVTLAITLNRQGQVLAVERRQGSGYPLLDAEALATARRASPLPAPDAAVPGDPVRIEVPVAFALGERLRS